MSAQAKWFPPRPRFACNECRQGCGTAEQHADSDVDGVATGAQQVPWINISTVHNAILDRIGRTFEDVTEDVATEPLPKQMAALLEQSDGRANVLCTLAEVLAHPEEHRLVERDGELFLS
jgi:hypothetical protein